MTDPQPASGSAPASVVRLYERSIAFRRQVSRLIDGAIDGGFLGLMDRDALDALDRSFYARTAEPVDGQLARYDEELHITSGLQAWEQEAIVGAFPAGGRVVVTSAGAGREVVALLELGFDAVGYEPNPALVAAGRRVLAARDAADRLQLVERDRFPPAVEAADAVLVGWGSYMLIAPRQRRVEFLRAARSVVAPGAPLMLSVFLRPPTRYFTVVQRTGNLVRALRRATPLEFGDALSPNFVHYFSEDEVRNELAEAGWASERFEPRPYAHAIARAAGEGRAP